MVNELYHNGVKGQRWGVRRYQNEDGTLTRAGQRRQVRQINSIYRHLDKQEKAYVTDEKKPPRRFTDVDEHATYAYKSFIAYDKKKARVCDDSVETKQWRSGSVYNDKKRLPGQGLRS